MKKLGYNYHFNLIDKNLTEKIYNKNKIINIIDVEFKFVKIFDKMSDKSNKYVNECFLIANNLLKIKKLTLLLTDQYQKTFFKK